MSDETLESWLSRDHERLGTLLDRSCEDGVVAAEPFHEFRGGLLRHIAMEEKILLPAARAIDAGAIEHAGARLRRDHAALAALLVPTPTPALIGRLRALLEAHDALEEGPGGIYSHCESILGARAAGVLQALESAPPVKLAPYQDGPRAFASIERLLRAAGRL